MTSVFSVIRYTGRGGRGFGTRARSGEEGSVGREGEEGAGREEGAMESVGEAMTKESEEEGTVEGRAVLEDGIEESFIDSMLIYSSSFLQFTRSRRRGETTAPERSVDKRRDQGTEYDGRGAISFSSNAACVGEEGRRVTCT
jgi:hypothetical protein